MFAQFLNRLISPNPQRLDAPDVQLALASILVRLARADGEYEQCEIDRIDRILRVRFELSPFEASELRTQAETVEANAPDTVRFTRAIKDAVSLEDRIAIIKAMWEVVLADGNRDEEEDAQMRLMSNLLGINDRDSALARQQVETK
ncbi:tellurite resistance TerB family protein [Cochlodiniinecator piscidefendens]|uniref:tellurite resistance TerB family protein n=1 Tax=Cochlodiniinecator piscidefendens TaxID=2715756 RepID=UPI00140949E7|nr:TerB family tellurite resistance protein [Cochlodiniinecator piscidefendens]